MKYPNNGNNFRHFMSRKRAETSSFNVTSGIKFKPNLVD